MDDPTPVESHDDDDVPTRRLTRDERRLLAAEFKATPGLNRAARRALARRPRATKE